MNVVRKQREALRRLKQQEKRERKLALRKREQQNESNQEEQIIAAPDAEKGVLENGIQNDF